MVSQRDIYASAQLLINKHGEDAYSFAYQRLQEFVEINNTGGASVWLSIMNAVIDLRNVKAPALGKLN